MTVICFIVCHLGSANQIADYQPILEKQGYVVWTYTTGSVKEALEKRQLKVRELNPNNLDLYQRGDEQQQLAQEVAKVCSAADVIVTDVGHLFAVQIHLALREYKKLHLAYYDNPDNWVGGGYSQTAVQVMRVANGVIVANPYLLEEGLEEEPGLPFNLKDKPCWGVGYYSLDKAMEIRQARLDAQHRAEMRRQFFVANPHLVDKGQKILVYIGGNNETYFEKALPATARMLTQAAQKEDFSDYIVVIHQHGGAKKRNEEAKLLPINDSTAPFACVLSQLSTDDVQILADAAFYYQTSLIYQTCLAGLPVMQIGHDTFHDRLIKKDLCKSVTTTDDFLKELKSLGQSSFDEEAFNQIKEAVGYDENWQERLKEIFR